MRNDSLLALSINVRHRYIPGTEKMMIQIQFQIVAPVTRVFILSVCSPPAKPIIKFFVTAQACVRMRP
jgi:hypothetical protein